MFRLPLKILKLAEGESSKKIVYFNHLLAFYLSGLKNKRMK